MGINRLLIDRRISGFWHGHTENRPGETPGQGRAGGRHRRARDQGRKPAATCAVATVAAVSALVERVGWSQLDITTLLPRRDAQPRSRQPGSANCQQNISSF